MLSSMPSPSTPARVLLVVDQSSLATMITFALEHLRCLTQVVPTADGAVTVLRDWQPHVAIINMDLDDGAMLTELGYTDPSTERIPVIALTRRGDMQTTLGAFEHGVDDVLSVPFVPRSWWPA